jgi:hypothetical protein
VGEVWEMTVVISVALVRCEEGVEGGRR